MVMSGKDLLVAVLLIIGCSGFVFTSLALLFMRDVFDQIQFLAPASLIGTVAIAAAVIVQEGFNQAGAKALLIALLLFGANPILSHATARAARIRHRGQWAATQDERIPAAEEEE
jgi:monovalent cation/proton antiporter MnhG/PhaG subunit